MQLRYLALTLFCCISTLAWSAGRFDVSCDGGVVEVQSPSGGPDAIFVVETSAGLEIKYTGGGASGNWESYDAKGQRTSVGAGQHSGNTNTLTGDSANCGYILVDGAMEYSVWIIDYSTVAFAPTGLNIDASSDCDVTVLRIAGQCADIHAYAPSGRRFSVSRDIRLTYTTEVLAGNELTYRAEQITTEVEPIDECLYLRPPVYARTRFSLTGDKFLKAWSKEKNVTSIEFDPQAVAASAKVSVNDSEIFADDVAELSAPVQLALKGAATSGAIHSEWLIYREDGADGGVSQDGTQFADEPLYRLSGLSAELTLKEAGVFSLLLRVADASGDCQVDCGPFRLVIAASQLSVPNTFIVGATGSAGTWRVKAESLVSFHCEIFDRHGQRIYSFSDPNDGWNGRRGSGYVSPGVYFYTIDATGADGRTYNKNGAINVLRRSRP